ncbi:MAG: ATP-binding protein [Thermodesulfobacteriota bacterium]|nr:ATP-binding protein [Thermodesulfobacteriota bacterium]
MKKIVDLKEVPPEKLRWECDPDSIGFETTEECEYTRSIIGQDRAIKSISMGLEIDSPGYNIYASGLTGTGKTSTIKNLLNELDLEKKVPDDICYVNNFSNPDMPMVLMFPAGMGKKFKKYMDELVLHLKKDIPLIFESEEFKKDSEQIANNYRTKQKELIREFNEKLAKENLQLVQFQIGPYTKQDIAPLHEGNPILLKQLEELAQQDKFDKKKLEKIKENLSIFRIELDSLMRETRQIEKEIRKEIGSLEYKYGLPVVSGVISDIRIKYENNNEKIKNYLDEVQEHILSNLKQFEEKDEGQQQQVMPAIISSQQKEKSIEYEVNVLVDNSQTDGFPVIVEAAPTYKSLFGTIEREIDRSGFWKTNFTRIKAGSLLRANGGYIVFNALEALIEPGVWTFLKRTLKNRLLIMQPYDPFSIASAALKPESIPLDVKVIMVGDDHLYHLLYNLEEDFKKIFKTKAHFDTEMPKTKENIDCYTSFIKMITEEENLLQFDKRAVAAVIEFGVKLTGRQKKLSTRFSDIADIVREASYWAKKEENTIVTDKHVDIAYTEKIERVNLIEDKIQEMIEDGTIMIDIAGEKAGQVNGLSVYDMGDYAFGKPSKITAETSMGKAGIINIEREAKLSGKTYDKGMLILEGYFRRKYAQDKPLTMSASICFEQSYGGVDGDSASSTEIYAILSSLSNLPIRQDTAVTGSVNQKGEIQPIGGVNQKIEGFYDVCKARGVSGTQGVMIPALNVSDLMLRKDVVESVSEGKFHIYPVSTINEGITILTGVEAGEMDEDGKFPEKTVNFLVNERLKTIATSLKDFSEEEKK